MDSAAERSSGSSLARVAEIFLFSRRPIERFLDIGAGAGLLLDNLSACLPDKSDMFYGVELFPPMQHSSHKNYITGGVAELTGLFDAGVCVEVIEHLTPKMLIALVRDLASISQQDSIYLFNTGMDKYVRNEDPAYLDPLGRGHIVSYSINGVRHIFSQHGFTIIELPGRSWAFLAEYKPTESQALDMRLQTPLPSNIDILKTNNLLYVAGFESARSYYFMHETQQRAKWAMGLAKQLHELEKEFEERTQWALDLDNQVSHLKEELHRILTNPVYLCKMTFRKLISRLNKA